jgi:hypothetical protein
MGAIAGLRYASLCLMAHVRPEEAPRAFCQAILDLNGS